MHATTNIKASLAAIAILVALLAGSTAQAEVIGARKERQQQRIAQGVASGQLTARETARLESHEARLNGEIRAMRRANGGTLTAGERALINRQQNRLSGQIYREKHDGERRP